MPDVLASRMSSGKVFADMEMMGMVFASCLSGLWMATVASGDDFPDTIVEI